MPSLRFIIHHDMSICLFGFPTKKDNRFDVPCAGEEIDRAEAGEGEALVT